ncbi:MAG: hypothetical protein ACI9MR_003709, partial [Myxococcota bacterium]
RYAIGPNVRLRKLLPKFLPQRVVEGALKSMIKRASRRG